MGAVKSSVRRKKSDVAAPSLESRREKNKREKLERILQVSRTLFRVNGYGATTTQQITAAAEIGSGTLFLYAKSKADLLLLVFRDELIAVIDGAWQSMPKDKPFRERLAHMININIEYHQKDLDTARALMRELLFPDNPERRKDILALQSMVIDRFAALVSDAQQQEKFRNSVDPKVVAECLFSIYHEQLHIWLSGYTSYDQFVENLWRSLDLVIDGVR